jgi:hypothetical protein
MAGLSRQSILHPMAQHLVHNETDLQFVVTNICLKMALI